MSLAITDDHRTLAGIASDFLTKREARGAARALLEAPVETLPPFWADLIELGWLGLHVPEEYDGAGYGLSELVVVVEELARAVAPGPFVPTVIASALIAAVGDEATKAAWLPGLVSGETSAGVALEGALEIRDGQAHGETGPILGGGLAGLVLVACGDDVVLLDLAKDGIDLSLPASLDVTRRSATATCHGAPAQVIVGARLTLRDLARVILAAEAVGMARECTEMAAGYAKVREQFGRPIAMFQAVKHHCANMLVATELATAAVWDAARAAETGGDQLGYTAALAATLASPAAYLCANLNIQVHGGIGMTWEHDAHLYLRRATVLRSMLEPDVASAELTDLTRAGVVRHRMIDLPPEAEAIRDEVREFVATVRNLDAPAQRDAMIETGYVMPHWPRPWGREAGPVEQIVIEEEFSGAGVKRPNYSITGWVILTLIQYATPEQVARWVPTALSQEVVWCQLFSEPGAGSDAASIRTKATRAEGGWIINGQKVWTSDAHLSLRGLATVRTNPDAPKHAGITTMVIDMKAPGVEVRPLRLTGGNTDFNEVFFNDVFVPDEDVVGPIDGGWTVARATLGNESVSIGGGTGLAMPPAILIDALDAHADRLAGGPQQVGTFIAKYQTIGLLNLRGASRAVAGAGPGPEGNVTKLVLSEMAQDAAAMLSALAGPDSAFLEGVGAMSGSAVLANRAISIAGGTSEIKRNQIGERILGLPRDPLIK